MTSQPVDKGHNASYKMNSIQVFDWGQIFCIEHPHNPTQIFNKCVNTTFKMDLLRLRGQLTRLQNSDDDPGNYNIIHSCAVVGHSTERR